MIRGTKFCASHLNDLHLFTNTQSNALHAFERFFPKYSQWVLFGCSFFGRVLVALVIYFDSKLCMNILEVFSLFLHFAIAVCVHIWIQNKIPPEIESMCAWAKNYKSEWKKPYISVFVVVSWNHYSAISGNCFANRSKTMLDQRTSYSHAHAHICIQFYCNKSADAKQAKEAQQKKRKKKTNQMKSK